jgi:peptidoglycan-N-acetylglucosamine deacetylase
MDRSGGRDLAVSRRAALLAGLSAAMMATYAGPTSRPRAQRRPDGFHLRLPGPDDFTVPAGPKSGLSPVPVRSRPVFRVQDLMPDAPANAVALTIDDGPHPYWTPRVLDLLAHYKVAATFCLVGLEVKAFPDLVRRAVTAGHRVCNHSYTHPQPFGRLAPDQLTTEIGTTQTVIYGDTGHTPRLFRAPGGAWNSTVFATVAAHGLYPIDWDVDPRDWSSPGSDTITRRLLAARPGDILLCHDGGGDRAETLASLTQVLPALLGRGLRFVPLDPPPITRRWTLDITRGRLPADTRHRPSPGSATRSEFPDLRGGA